MNNPAFFERSDLTRTLWMFRREFFVVGIFSVVANLLMLTPTLYMLQVYDRVMVSGSKTTLLAVTLITVFLLAVMAFCEWLRSRLLVRAGLRLDEQLSTKVFNASFESYLVESGGNPSRSFADLTELRQFLTGNGIFALFDAPWAPIYLAVLFMLHPWLGVTAIFFTLVQAALAWWGHHRTIEPQLKAIETQNDVTQYLQGKLRNAEVLEAMGMVGNLRTHWDARHDESLRAHHDAQSRTSRITAWSKFIRYSQQSLVLGIGALLVIDGQISPGAMIASNVLMGRALAPLDLLVGSWRGFIGARDAFARLEALLQGYPERDPLLTRVPPVGALTLRGVVAKAEGRAEPILKNVDLVAHPGTMTAVLGPSGSGKSTLARVIMGIWPDTAGEVLLDGRPISGWNRTELGPYLGYLPQDIELFEGTIAENIGRFTEIDSARVIAAAESAGLHEMILRFPKGYDTLIGEAGGLLSGGQRQRIGLARALYGDPVLVVLDEPNANLDDVGELALLKAVQELKAKGKTVIVISHRPGVVAAADRLLVLRNGYVHASGPRDEVLPALQSQRQASSASPSSPTSGAAGNPVVA